MTIAELKEEFDKQTATQLCPASYDMDDDNTLIVFVPFGTESIRVQLLGDEQGISFCIADDGDWYNPVTGEYDSAYIHEFNSAAELVDFCRSKFE